MKKSILLTIILLTQYFLYSQSTELLDAMNEFGGETYLIKLAESDPNSSMIESKTVYLDEKRTARKLIFQTTEDFRSDRGIVRQLEFFNSEGIREKYEMYFSEEHSSMYAITKTIEYLDDQDNVIKTEWFQGDEIVDTTTDMNFNNKFPFYKLSFINYRMTEPDYTPDDKFDFGTSVKYIAGRSVIRFKGEMEDLNDLDRKYLQMFGMHLGNSNLNSYYDKKIIATEDDKEYVLFIQKPLEEYVFDGNRAKINYYIGTYENTLILTIIGFLDLY
ncbi:hypothetical protein [Spirochaeta isovalerica]|uniref:Uncharacterized protein n=1 Tax=Spirochaeta isovalerica TaxID=150 RepID=A0A841R895_9SPIO|nr:hypothetical protein [Spirochaeta isovalerica]MBB6481504.1 hypothetical protein [Spirochaeta isovalerica]